MKKSIVCLFHGQIIPLMSLLERNDLMNFSSKLTAKTGWKSEAKIPSIEFHQMLKNSLIDIVRI